MLKLFILLCLYWMAFGAAVNKDESDMISQTKFVPTSAVSNKKCITLYDRLQRIKRDGKKTNAQQQSRSKTDDVQEEIEIDSFQARRPRYFYTKENNFFYHPKYFDPDDTYYGKHKLFVVNIIG